MLAQMSTGMRNFAEQYGIAINDPTLIRRYRMNVDARREEATKISVAERNAHIEDARRMKKKGYPAGDISEITGLSEKDIEDLD